jgi:ribosomal protein L37AE/L43A
VSKTRVNKRKTMTRDRLRSLGLDFRENESRTEAGYPCPLCQSDSRSASVNLASGLYHCHRCKRSGHIAGLASRLRGRTTASRVQRLKEAQVAETRTEERDGQTFTVTVLREARRAA